MTFRVTVVGAGIVGLSAAWALWRDGHQVTVYEQKALPNSLGSSVDQHRLIRYPYGSELGYTCMVTDAYQAWEKLWTDINKKLYAPTGTLVLAKTGESWANDSADTLGQLGLSVQWLDADQLQHTFPLLVADDVESAFYLDSGGVLLADQIITAMVQHLNSRGVTFHTQVQVREIVPDLARIVLSNGIVVDADTLVVAAGPWVTRLLPDLSQRVTPSRQVVVYLEPPPDTIAQWIAAPMILDIDPDSGFYLVPPVLGTELKIGDHRFTLTGDPDCEREADEAEARTIFEQCKQRLKEFDRYRLQRSCTCFYTVAPQERFIVECLGNSWLMTGFSGHGFKFGPLLGLALAEAVAGRRTADELSQWAAGHAI
ncbi:NAD(P)/FAD-dependent oxidoreductase [Dendronalium sp. ChiSLP03b]|uniref:NAD(P)/FAD-dependent oxidoreductase n=1 Tax=Dendronalium sp. ChiSLP03b TaxID=3075381 RepID=UPI002AD2142A|nr:FAD-dependent oxidoreductase [Dendronalium sp. ChiSLP03b]MDZ8208100.1 FAD-dependent oxidoreductase [Dendronalium sp. ChiSLP03b]